ncbi:uncharacterized protein DDB_G0286299 [Folsomia candida]|uniref:uncharacterized protein DDB_G0286299 n=1 Tax=Folsomia candida TaxID=158441 RepID=UPI000B9026BF|nr:uncharacterized protein DDB_G0286299 [Folsomia candida]
MQFRNPSRMGATLLITTLLSVSNVGGQFYADYGDTGGGLGVGGGGGYNLNPFDIPVIYKQDRFPASYPVAPTIYQVALMKPIEPMPGKKTVPLYIVPEESLLVNPNNFDNHLHRAKRSIDPHGLRLNIKYPQFYGLTDGYHIPAVEIPLHKPMIVRQIEVNVLAPEGFMVPYQSDDRQWPSPYPMTTGCLVASIPRNEYVSDDHPITIRRLFAVPSLPEYPTYRPAFPNHGQLAYPGQVSSPHVHPPHGDGVTLNFYPNGQAHPPHSHPHSRPVVYAHPTQTSKAPVFELVPVTPKSNRRNGNRRKGGKNKDDDDSDEDRDRSEEDDDNNDSSSKDSQEENSDEDEKRDSRRCRDRDGSRSGRRNCGRNRNRNSRDRSSTTRRTTTTTGSSTTTRTTTTPTTTTPTTTTPSTTTPAASSIQDIIAAFSSYRDRERERDDRRNRISASFYEDEERERKTSTRSRGGDRDRSQQSEGLRSGNSASYSSRDRDRDRDRVVDDDDRPRNNNDQRSPPPTPPPPPPPRDLLAESSPERESRTSSSIRDVPSDNNINELREQALQRQISQLHRLLSSLNLTQEDSNSNNTTSQQQQS